MERITFNLSQSKKAEHRVRYRLRDGRNLQICHTSDIIAKPDDLSKLNVDGSTVDRVKVYNRDLSVLLAEEYKVMVAAYAIMVDKGLDKTTQVWEEEIAKIKNPILEVRSEKQNIVKRFRIFADDALRHGIIGADRHKHITIVIDKLERFLLIKGVSGITADEFDVRYLMDFRDFLFNEYEYVEQYPKVYARVKEQNRPKARLSMNTVVSQMKMFSTFLTNLEDCEEISRSPFRKLGKERKKVVMKTKYDDPIFLRKEELMRVLDFEAPEMLKDVKDAFLVQCAFGCRVSDFQKMGMSKIAVSEEGIPYIYYIPQKTADVQIGNEEIQTPIVRYAFDIIKRTGFNFPVLRNIYGAKGYNAYIKLLLKLCKIDRKVPQYNEETKQNDYVELYKAGSSKLCRKTHVDILSKYQVNQYAAGLHKEGSAAVNRYTKLELKDRFALLNAAFDQQPYKVDSKLNLKTK